MKSRIIACCVAILSMVGLSLFLGFRTQLQLSAIINLLGGIVVGGFGMILFYAAAGSTLPSRTARIRSVLFGSVAVTLGILNTARGAGHPLTSLGMPSLISGILAISALIIVAVISLNEKKR